MARLVASQFWLDGDGGVLDVRVLRTTNNRVMAVNAARGRFVLRRHRDGYRSARELESEAEFVHRWSADGGSRLSPLPTRDGAWVAVAADGSLWTMLLWVDGESLQPGRGAGRAELRRVGEGLARLHEFSLRFDPPAWFDRPTWRLPDEARRWRGGVTFTGDEARSIDRATVLVKQVIENWLSREPVMLIHQDPVLLNWLHHDGTATLIDFDDLGWGCRAADVGAVLENLEGNDALRAEFLGGYTSVIELPAHDRSELDAAVLLRHFNSLRWALAGHADGHLPEELVDRLRRYRLEAIRRHLD